MVCPICSQTKLVSTFVRGLLATAVMWVISVDVSAATLSVMSFNIRNASGFSSGLIPPNGWFDATADKPLENGRRLRALGVIRANDPDVLGVQESISTQTMDLKRELSGYHYFGVGRDDGDEFGEQNGIFFRSSRFSRIDGGHFWLSTTPDVPGTTFATSFDSGNPRMVTWVVLHDQLTGKPFVVLNTHWSLSSSARNQSANLIRTFLPQIADSRPTIIMGDLNTTESSSAFRTLQGTANPNDLLLVDAYRQIHERSNQEATFHGYGGGTSGSRIDHILFSDGDFTAIDATIDRTTFDGLQTSDHYPVTATLAVVPEPAIIPLAVLPCLAIVGRRPRRLKC